MALADVTDALLDLQEDITITVSTEGARVKGSWVAGATTLDTAMAVVQPASSEDVNELSIEGDSDVSYKVFFSTYKFKTANKKAQTEADIINYGGESFKVQAVADWFNIGGYYKATTIRIN